jgi:hypothetical protein
MPKNILVLTAVIIIILFLACGKTEKGDDKSTSGRHEATEAIDVTVLQKAAEKKIESFAASLKASLSEAIREGGPANAIGVCSEVAMDIANAHSEQGYYISRVTDYSRNKNNQANPMEKAILDEFINEETGPSYSGEWVQSSGKKTYRFYKPIYVKEICLNCHGRADQLKPEVTKKLAELYPKDEAVGYKVGDLRGMFVVEIEWPKGREYTEKLTAGDTAR